MRLLIASLLIAISISPALAEMSISADVNGKRIVLLSQPGQCPLNPDDPKDADEIKRLKLEDKSMNYLHITADCNDLKLWRKGDLDNYGTFTQIVSVSPQIDLSGKGDLYFEAACNEFRKISQHKEKSIRNNLKTYTLSAIETFAKQKTDSLNIGTISEDDTGCYVAQISNYRDGNDTRTLMSVVSFTLIKGRVINFHRFTDVTPETAGKIPQQLLAAIKATVTAHLAANPEE